MVKTNRNVIHVKTTWILDPQERKTPTVPEDGYSPDFQFRNSRHNRSRGFQR